jgi:hypothetical protein
MGEGKKELEERWEKAKQLRDKAIMEQEKLKQQIERTKTEDLERTQKQIKFVDLCRDLGLDPLETNIDSVKEIILEKDKYLRLAVAGLETRCDWSDGCWRVQNSLDKFQIESDPDESIYEEWRAICREFSDGRSFSTAYWNYDAVFDLAQSDVFKLWNRAQEI